eukprot:scaffold57994_cov35-Tisochrysis_lutea.AAC.2
MAAQMHACGFIATRCNMKYFHSQHSRHIHPKRSRKDCSCDGRTATLSLRLRRASSLVSHTPHAMSMHPRLPRFQEERHAPARRVGVLHLPLPVLQNCKTTSWTLRRPISSAPRARRACAAVSLASLSNTRGQQQRNPRLTPSAASFSDSKGNQKKYTRRP